MAKENYARGCLRAAFFVVAAGALAAAVVTYLAMPAQAQPAADCAPVAEMVLYLEERLPDGAVIDHLGATRAETYQAALTDPPVIFADAMLVEGPDGTGFLVQVIDGWVCRDAGGYAIPPPVHKVAALAILW